MRIRVRSGDTLWYYSRLFMLPLNLIQQSNPEINANAIKIGQEIIFWRQFARSDPGLPGAGYEPRIKSARITTGVPQAQQTNPQTGRPRSSSPAALCRSIGES